MQRLIFRIQVHAPADNVWETLWNEGTYRIWNSVIEKGSYAESEWLEGGKVWFLSPKGNGLSSIIEKKVPGQLMVFRHLGVVVNKTEQPDDPRSREWVGLRQYFKLERINGKTELSIEMDATDDYAPFFSEVFPEALKKIKTLTE